MDPTLRACTLSEQEILRYRSFGSGPRRLILIHGLAANSHTWTDLIPLFPPERYTIHLLDLLGSGESSKPGKGDYSIRGHAQRLLDFMEREGLAGATPVGHSLGGAVVLMAALLARETGRERLFSSVVVIGGPGFIQGLPLIAEIFRFPLAGELFISLYSPDIWVKVGLRAAYHDHRLIDREHIARYASCYRERSSKRALVETCRQLVPPDAEEIARGYGELRTPFLLLWGRHDRIVPLAQGERLERAIPGARLSILEDCGHNPQEEKPQETFAIIDRFVDEVAEPAD